MSISGDSVIMRNGRSTSQVSIYNYPEHLNPFYEEDQHKRLRFWKTNKNADNDRWKSISITSLKDLWPLKSFRMSKKKSSTLGINKTSESPPILRRDLADYNYTINRSSLQTDPYTKRATSMGFERNDQYRSTIQIMNGNQTLPLNKRYNFGRSFTPQPQRSNFMETPTLSRRSGSRTSTTSTNPFDESDDDVENYFHRGPMQTQSLMPSQRKKKRRAPIPTTLSNKSDEQTTSPSINNASLNTELRIEEDEDLSISNLATQIQNFVDTTLDKETDVTDVQQTPAKDKNTNRPTATSTPKIVIEEVTNEEPKKDIVEITTTIIKTPTEKDILPETKVEIKQEEINIENKAKVETKPREPSDVSRVNHINTSTEEVTIKTPFILTTPPTPIPSAREMPDFNLEEPVKMRREIVILGPLTGPEKPKRSSVTKRTVEFMLAEQEMSAKQNQQLQLEQQQQQQQQQQEPQQIALEKEKQQQRPEEYHTTKTTISIEEKQQNKPIIKEKPQKVKHVVIIDDKPKRQREKIENPVTEQISLEPLKIVEPLEELHKETEVIEQQQQQQHQEQEEQVAQMYTSTTTTTHIFNGESTGAIPRTRDWKNSTLAPLQTSVPPEKRKSAKEIIESINRQQRLLKEAAERNMPETRNTSNNRLQGVIIYNHFKQTAINSNDLNNGQKQQTEQRQNGHVYMETEFRDPQKLENGSPPVFAKCRVYKEGYPQRESSPTTSNLDWNPLPKPKRNKDIQLD